MATTTLILGAGLGLEYGFPDGPQLLEDLKNELSDNETELKKILDWSGGETVDAIASRRPEHADRLRNLVTNILLSREDESKLISTGKSSTYKVMIDQIGEAQAIGDSINIITFNYDRSLPYLIHQMNSVETRKERRLNHTIINHIYGRLAPLSFEIKKEEFDFHSYGGGCLSAGSFTSLMEEVDEDNDSLWDDGQSSSRTSHINRLMKERHEEDMLHRQSNIAFIGEIVNRPSNEIKEILEKSDQIFILGMAYHAPNMKVLGLDFTKKYPHKIIAGTVFKMNEDEIKGIKEKYHAIDKLENCNALTFLKYKFPINEFMKNISKKEVSILDVL